jgi:carbon storage regulator
MLVLSRKLNEVIDIGNEISICVVDIRGDKVRLGIVAPKDVSVNRREVTLAIAAQITKALESQEHQQANPQTV